MVDVSQYNGKFHLASEPAPHVLLLEFNRSVDRFYRELGVVSSSPAFCS